MKFISFALTLLLSQADAKLGGGGDDNHDIVDGVVEHLDLEVVVESGERQLFPLLPGTKCPAGHTCRVRTTSGGWAPEKLSPMGSSLKDSLKTPLAMAMNWDEFNNNMNTVVVSNDYCTRRAAMTRAAGLAAGVAAATVAQPAYAAATTKVKMGDDSGLLTFVPKKINICAGDSIEWYVFLLLLLFIESKEERERETDTVTPLLLLFAT